VSEGKRTSYADRKELVVLRILEERRGSNHYVKVR
jgi:hypothetical protein